jgi:hypothetical protein
MAGALARAVEDLDGLQVKMKLPPLSWMA